MVNETPNSVNLLDDPKFSAFLNDFNLLDRHAKTLSLPEQRVLSTEFFIKHTHCNESIFKIEDVHFTGSDNNSIRVRIYTPRAAKELPIMLYFHGGGWVFGCIEDADAACRRLCNHLDCIVASVDYRLAPENPFPKPLEDCYAAAIWMSEHAGEFGGDPKKLMVGGESAGGNLAGAVALMARDKKGPHLAAQLLIYPAISTTIKDTIYDSYPDHYFLTKEYMRFFLEMYAQKADDAKNPYVSLDLATSFKGLPPALIVTAEYDALSYDAKKYAERLQQAGIPAQELCIPKVVHGFLFIPVYEEKQKAAWTKSFKEPLYKLLSERKGT